MPDNPQTTDDSQTVLKYWAIVREPRKFPETKGGFTTANAFDAFLRELFQCRSDDVQITVVMLTWDNDIWVTDGREHLDVLEGYRGKGVRRQLASIKKKGGERISKKLTDKKVRIWSGEHGCWWRRNGSGYTLSRHAAGIYDFTEAFERTHHCDRDKRIVFEVAHV